MILRFIPQKNLNAKAWLMNRITPLIYYTSSMNDYLMKVQGNRDPAFLSFLLVKSKFKYFRKVVKFFNYFSKPLFPQNCNTTFYPFSHGVEGIITHLISLCDNQKVTFHYSTIISEVKTDNSKKIIIKYLDKNQGDDCFDYIFSSIDLISLQKMIFRGNENSVISCFKELEYTDSYVFLFGLSKIANSNHIRIIYAFEKKYKWRRLTIIEREHYPIALFVEHTFTNKENIVPKIVQTQIIEDLTQDISLFSLEEIIEKKIVHVENTYPIFDLGFRNLTDSIIKEIEKDNIIIIGRQGLFNYWNTDDVITSTERKINEFKMKLV